MKRLITLLLCASLLSLVPSAAAQRLVDRIDIYSDLHVVEPEQAQGLVVASGERKLLTHSASLLVKHVDDCLAAEKLPRVVLVTGDMTERGDMASHRYVAAQLARLKEKGVRVLVIPGNHDIGKEVDKQQFARIYADYGYDSEVRDDNSLSYVCEPVKGIVIVAIDSNGDSGKAIDWAAGQAARHKGKTVIAMMHHHLIPHFEQESRILPTSVVNDSPAMRDKLINAGVHLVFTGHTHIHDVAVGYNSSRTDSVVEACTGALSGYPIYHRVVELKGRKIVNDYSPRLDKLCGEDVQSLSRQLLASSIPQQVHGLVSRYLNKDGLWSRIQSFPMISNMLADGIDARLIESLVDKHLTPHLVQAFILASEGDEGNKDTKALRENIAVGVREVVRGLVKPGYQDTVAGLLLPRVNELLMPVVNSVLEDLNPPSVVPVGDTSFSAFLPK